MLFEVYRNGVALMGTDYRECIYPLSTMLNMKAAGLTFKYQGKRYTPKKGNVELRKEVKSARR